MDLIDVLFVARLKKLSPIFSCTDPLLNLFGLSCCVFYFPLLFGCPPLPKFLAIGFLSTKGD